MKSDAFPVARSRRWLPFTLVLSALGLCGFQPVEEFLKSRAEQLQIEVHAMPETETVRPGDTFKIYVVATPQKGWHFYSMEAGADDPTLATRIEITASPFTAQGAWVESPPTLKQDEALGRPVKVHSHRAEFSRTLSVPEHLATGMHAVQGVLTYRICDNKVCALPQDRPFQFHVIVKPEN